MNYYFYSEKIKYGKNNKTVSICYFWNDRCGFTTLGLGKSMYMDDLYVKSDFWGNGLGTKLIKKR